MTTIQTEINWINKFYEMMMDCVRWLQAPVLFSIRIIWGVLFMLEGWYKFSHIASNVSYFSDLGFSYPTLMVYLAATAQLVGGAFMMLGLFSRLTMIPLMFTMIVAAVMDPSKAHFLGHGSGQTETFLAQIPLVFFYACLAIFLFGPGKWSLDHHLKDKCLLCR